MKLITSSANIEILEKKINEYFSSNNFEFSNNAGNKWYIDKENYLLKNDYLTNLDDPIEFHNFSYLIASKENQLCFFDQERAKFEIDNFFSRNK